MSLEGTEEIKPGSAIDIFLKIADILVQNGTSVMQLEDGQLRRFFNENIKNTASKEEREAMEKAKQEKKPEPVPKGKALHDSLKPTMSKHEAELRSLIEKYSDNWQEKISDEFVNEFEKIFDKINKDLTEHPAWNKYWNNLDPKPSQEEVEHAKERVLMAYRFKMFQMITGEMKVAKEQVPKLDQNKQPIPNEFVQKPKYDIKKVASLDIVLQKLNGAYDRRKGHKRSLQEQFRDEYRNESGPAYVVDLNVMLEKAIRMKIEGKPQEEINKFIVDERAKIQSEVVKKDKYALHVGETEAKKLFDELFPASLLQDKVENYDKVCKELGFDVNAMARLMEGCKETKKGFNDPNSTDQTRALEHKDVLVLEDYIKMLKQKAYIKGYENSKNTDIFAPFDEEKFKRLQKQAEEIIQNNPTVSESRKLFLKNDLFTAAEHGDYEKFKNMIQLGANLSDVQNIEDQRPKTAFEIILPKLKSRQLENLLQYPEIATQYKQIKKATDELESKCWKAALEGDAQGIRIFIKSGVNITKENENGESILDIAKRTLNEVDLKRVMETARRQSEILDLDNPMQHAIVTTYAKDIHVMEFFEFRDALEKGSRLEGNAKVNAAKSLLEDFIYGMNPDVVSLNLDGHGTPEKIVKLRDELKKFTDKLGNNSFNQEDAVKVFKLCKEIEQAYSKYLLNKGGQLPNENSRAIISSKFPVHTFIESYSKYHVSEQSDRNYVWSAIKKQGDFNSKNLDGVRPLEMAARTGNKDLIARVLDGGAKTTEYKRGFFQKMKDAFKGFPKNLKHFNQTPPRNMEEIKKLTGKGFSEIGLIERIIETEKAKGPLPEVVVNMKSEVIGPEKEKAKEKEKEKDKAELKETERLEVQEVNPQTLLEANTVQQEIPKELILEQDEAEQLLKRLDEMSRGSELPTVDSDSSVADLPPSGPPFTTLRETQEQPRDPLPPTPPQKSVADECLDIIKEKFSSVLQQEGNVTQIDPSKKVSIVDKLAIKAIHSLLTEEFKGKDLSNPDIHKQFVQALDKKIMKGVQESTSKEVQEMISKLKESSTQKFEKVRTLGSK
ncbi:MAG: hypothetical protein JSR17_04910 [Proteobacteria bacterium]|nr:hypothetical protein [Pseudomonadota bacterium]